MNRLSRRVFRLFFLWQDEQEEQWLEKQAREGWRLTKAGVIYRFERDEPREVRYRLDYRSTAPGGWQEYLELFRDAGWEHVDRFGGWQYFRAVSRDAPEVFTDAASKAQKYRSVLAVLMLALLVNLFLFSHGVGTYSWIKPLQGALLVTLGYGTIRILGRLRRLRSHGT